MADKKESSKSEPSKPVDEHVQRSRRAVRSTIMQITYERALPAMVAEGLAAEDIETEMERLLDGVAVMVAKKISDAIETVA